MAPTSSSSKTRTINSNRNSGINKNSGRVRRFKSPLTPILANIISESPSGCLSTCEAVRTLLRRSPPCVRGVPLPCLRKRVGDILLRSPWFLPSPTAFNHGRRRRYGLAMSSAMDGTSQHSKPASRGVLLADVIKRSNILLDEAAASVPLSIPSHCTQERPPPRHTSSSTTSSIAANLTPTAGTLASSPPILPAQPATSAARATPVMGNNNTTNSSSWLLLQLPILTADDVVAQMD
ncbi:uncharacterized protein [Panulirus ornatus]|uniref:uncharacterized protein n=1 Tax=Panulirus ornatus TaxID=150431 RepID=UPI003A8818BA